MFNNASTHPGNKAGYRPAGYCTLCVSVCAGVCTLPCVCVCLLYYESDVQHQAEVSDVYSITELNLELHVNHTSNINDNIYIYTVYVSNVYTNISYPLTSAATDSRGNAAVFLFGLYHERSK